jgi:hypothetical protein
VFSRRCVERAVPIWGKPEDGTASAKTRKTPLWSAIARLLAPHGGAPGAYSDMADAALGTEDHLMALRDTWCISRLPATYAACARVLQEAGAHQAWQEVGVLAQTQPPKHRPLASYKAAESAETLEGTSDRAVVVQSSAHEQRRQKRLDRGFQAASTTLQAALRAAEQPVYGGRAEAEAAATTLRAMQTDSHRVEVTVEERPT